jgi:hypothetical protein
MTADPAGISKRVSKTTIAAEIMRFTARQDDGGHEYVSERRLRLDQKPLLDDLFRQKEGGQAFVFRRCREQRLKRNTRQHTGGSAGKLRRSLTFVAIHRKDDELRRSSTGIGVRPVRKTHAVKTAGGHFVRRCREQRLKRNTRQHTGGSAGKLRRSLTFVAIHRKDDRTP